MKFSDFELEVLHLFWQLGQATTPAIHAAIEEKRPVSYTTVKTIVDRLEKKGALKRLKSFERSILYTPTVRREALSKPMLKRLVEVMFNGKVRPIMSALLEEENLNLDDLAYLESIIDQKKEALKGRERGRRELEKP